MRAMWISSVVNIDWPSTTGLSAGAAAGRVPGLARLAGPPASTRSFVQVRPTADAFWPSPFEPWSQYLTGTQGGDPGYDPLAFAGRRGARAQPGVPRLVQPVPASRCGTDTDAARRPTHPARQHPDWVVPYGGKLYYNPGHPAGPRASSRTRSWTRSRSYDIDGVHFDDYFYPYPVGRRRPSDDAATYAQYGAGFADHRPTGGAHNIDLLVAGDRAADQGGQAVGEVRHQPVRRSGATAPPTRSAPTPRRRRSPTTTCIADTRKWVTRGLARLHRPADLLARSGSPSPTTPSSSRGGPTSAAAPARSSTSARRCTR